MKAIAAVLMVVCGAGALCGCVKYTKPVAAAPKLTPAQKNFVALWQGSLDVLRDYGFTVDRQDRREGLITTRPLVGRQWFEFWRKDAATSYDVLEGSLQTVYRTALVRIRVTDPNTDNYQAGVEVVLTRSDKEQSAVKTVSDAYGMFTMPGGEDAITRPKLGNTMLATAPPVPDPNSVVSLATDPVLSRKLADEISYHAGKRLLEGPR